MALVVETHSEEETRDLGADLGLVVRAGDVLLLLGACGAGKTTLVQGLARGMGIDDVVTSPSFVIANEYQGRIPLYHIDLYRIDEMDSTTLEALSEYFGGDGVCVVEWPAAVPGDLVDGAVRVSLATTGENSRSLTFEDGPDRLQAVFGARGVLADAARS